MENPLQSNVLEEMPIPCIAVWCDVHTVAVRRVDTYAGGVLTTQDDLWICKARSLQQLFDYVDVDATAVKENVPFRTTKSFSSGAAGYPNWYSLSPII